MLEHWIHAEIRSYLDYSRSRGELGYWRTPSGSEVDFLWWYGEQAVAVEVKASRRFKPEFLTGLMSLAAGKRLESSWLVYLGDRELEEAGVHVVPVSSFLRRLHDGEVLGRPSRGT